MKKGKNYSIDEELIEKVKEEAHEKDRSESYVVNEILKKHYQ